MLGWPNGSGGSLQSCSIWVQLPSPAPTEAYIYFLRQHLREVTVPNYLKRLGRLSKIGNLDKPEQIKNIICTYQSTESYKELLAHSYDYYVKFKGLTWEKPHFVREDKPIFLPLEAELNSLISKPRLKMSVFLQFLKETGADSGEAQKLRWIDINPENNLVAITPTKNHNARTLKVSSKLISRLLQLPRRSEFVFDIKSLDGFRAGYEAMKNNLSFELGNPRIAEIAFRTFRHWFATSQYSKTKDILHIKHLLGHKRLENTLVYTHLVPCSSDDYLCKIAKTLEEATALIEAGFEYVTEMNGVKLFRKRK
jgi:integrase